MAQHVAYGHVNPPPNAWNSSQDTVEDLNLYEDQSCVPPDARKSNTNSRSSETSFVQAFPSTGVEVIAMKAQIQELERNITLQIGRISALEAHNQLLECMLTDFEECFKVLGQKIRNRKQGSKNEGKTEVGKGCDFGRKSIKRVRFL